MAGIFESFGNGCLSQRSKTGFYASAYLQSDVIMRCYDWATGVSNGDWCIVSGFSLPMERAVLHFLLKGSFLIVVVLVRRLYQIFPEEWRSAMDRGRMLIVST